VLSLALLKDINSLKWKLVENKKPFSVKPLRVLIRKIKKKLESKKLNWYMVLSELKFKE